MDMNELFITATRNKFRFPFKGMIGLEDLWDLSLANLDSVFKTLNAEFKQVKEESLLSVKSAEDAVLDAKISIIKYIVSVKQREAEQRVKAAEKREQKRRIMEIVSAKQDAELQNKSIDELQKMLEDLDA